MDNLNQIAQTSLEYLTTYGWALVIVATVVGVLIFVTSPPQDIASFSSSDSGKIFVKDSVVQDTIVTIAA